MKTKNDYPPIPTVEGFRQIYKSVLDHMNFKKDYLSEIF